MRAGGLWRKLAIVVIIVVVIFVLVTVVFPWVDRLLNDPVLSVAAALLG